MERRLYTMNDRNTDLFFGDEDDVLLTLTDEDGNDVDAQIIAAFEIEELSAEYIAVLEVNENHEVENGEVIVLRYSEDEDGDPVIDSIDDEDEYEIVTEAFRQLVESGAVEGFSYDGDEDEEDDIDDNYLKDIGDMFPGVSIDKD